ncbi:MAG TPA: PP2C family protein-serine/threonine phosphatase [Phycisphaerales bacterium]|nr:PP2C family protein-serine/threonine phosphatase [Phycisphaerales bacterium]
MAFFEGSTQAQMDHVVAMMRDMSTRTDPQDMVRTYRAAVAQLVKTDATMALSRRGLERPWFRITRSTRWKESINPWSEKDKLPLMRGGLLAELLYADRPTIIQDLRVDAGDPAYEYLKGYGSLYAMPLFEHGEAVNMNVALMAAKNGINEERAPVMLWMGNLFGRATANLVLADQLRKANDALDRELQAVSAIQRSLLPPTLPDVKGLRLAAHYETSARAGGDYYDLFPLSHGRLGLLIADVSGHGTPAAVMMAITHALAHSNAGTPCAASNEPAEMLTHLNERLVRSYSRGNTGFVTAFYGVFDPAAKTLRYASAGHNPPRVRRGSGTAPVVEGLEGGRDVPLGVLEGTTYREAATTLYAGDGLLLYTDGITEARSPDGEEFGTERLDQRLVSTVRTQGASVAMPEPGWTIQGVLESVTEFTRARPPEDDRTLVAGEIV